LEHPLAYLERFEAMKKSQEPHRDKYDCCPKTTWKLGRQKKPLMPLREGKTYLVLVARASSDVII